MPSSPFLHCTTAHRAYYLNHKTTAKEIRGEDGARGWELLGTSHEVNDATSSLIFGAGQFGTDTQPFVFQAGESSIHGGLGAKPSTGGRNSEPNHHLHDLKVYREALDVLQVGGIQFFRMPKLASSTVHKLFCFWVLCQYQGVDAVDAVRSGGSHNYQAGDAGATGADGIPSTSCGSRVDSKSSTTHKRAKSESDEHISRSVGDMNARLRMLLGPGKAVT